MKEIMFKKTVQDECICMFVLQEKCSHKFYLRFVIILILSLDTRQIYNNGPDKEMYIIHFFIIRIHYEGQKHYSKIKDISEGNEKRIRDAKEVRIKQGGENNHNMMPD